MHNFNILTLPSWKVEIIKDEMAKEWADENKLASCSVFARHVGQWLRALV
jgi:hypothetical protein